MSQSVTTGILAHTFTFSSHALRVIMRDGEPWFVAADVCAALTIGNPSQALARLDDDETTLISTEGQAGNGAQSQNLVNESGLYSLILGSRKPEAKKFKKWVTSEVLPAIRKTGRYIAPTAPVCAAESITNNDLQNIKRLIWLAVHGFRYQGSWTQAVWFDLRKVLAWPSPARFTVDQIPAIGIELQRIYGAANQVQALIADIEQQAAKRIFRKGEAADVVVADLKRLAEARLTEVTTDLKALPTWLQHDMQALTQRKPAYTAQSLDPEKPGYFA